MEHILLWYPEDWTERETYEAMIQALGGPDLHNALSEARSLRLTVESLLTPGQRQPYAEAEDAAADANALRETAATRAALVHGIAIGAALTAFPGAPAAPLLHTGAALSSSLLASGLPSSTASALNQAILDALNRAESVAAQPR